MHNLHITLNKGGAVTMRIGYGYVYAYAYG
jgi:hypothetical protein